MKKLGMTFLLLFSLVLGAEAAKTEIAVTVNGMVCSFCAQGITKKFKALPEVDTVKVVLENQKVYLSLKEGPGLRDDSITEILREAGYSVEKIDRNTP